MEEKRNILIEIHKDEHQYHSSMRWAGFTFGLIGILLTVFALGMFLKDKAFATFIWTSASYFIGASVTCYGGGQVRSVVSAFKQPTQNIPVNTAPPPPKNPDSMPV
jgi:hypothetical protein